MREAWAGWGSAAAAAELAAACGSRRAWNWASSSPKGEAATGSLLLVRGERE